MLFSTIGTLAGLIVLPLLVVVAGWLALRRYRCDTLDRANWLTWTTRLIVAFLVGAIGLVVIRGCHVIPKGTAARNRAAAFHRAIISGLEQYHSDFGEYPKPMPRNREIELDGRRYQVDAALMLYQTMTGDGNDCITTSKSGYPSDGKITNDELKFAKLQDIPREMILQTPAGYILVDSFGHPFQYSTGNMDTVNTTFDLWSFAQDEPIKATRTTKQSPEAGHWIKNW